MFHTLPHKVAPALAQFEFQIVKGAARNTVFCTARSEALALAVVRECYSPEFAVVDGAVARHAAHRIYGEIDASERLQ